MEKVNERNEKKSFLRPRCKIAVKNRNHKIVEDPSITGDI